MDLYLLVHPLIAALAGAMLLAAFFLKRGRRVFFNAHYLSGTAAVLFGLVAVLIAMWAYGQFSIREPAQMASLAAFGWHRWVAYLALGLLLAQGLLGWYAFFARRGSLAILRIHRVLASALVIIVAAAGALGAVGLLHLGGLLSLSSTRWLGPLAAIVVPLGGYVLWQGLQISDDPRARDRDRRAKVRPAANHIEIFPDDIRIQARKNDTLLQSSLDAGIAHTHICGGHARCSTCRVMILDGHQALEPRNTRELQMAMRLGFDDNIRLACQTRIQGAVKIRRFVLDDDDVTLTNQIQRQIRPGRVGDEKRLAILFCDIRNFSTFSENLPPYDVVHALNRYYQNIGRIALECQGEINNYMGDGLLVLFESNDPKEATGRAIQAGLQMVAEMRRMRSYFQKSYGRGIDIGIGIHYGEAVVGDLGAVGEKRRLVIGESINFASRIDDANKAHGTSILISDEAFNQVLDRVRIGRQVAVTVKGRREQQILYEVVGMVDEQRTSI